MTAQHGGIRKSLPISFVNITLAGLCLAAALSYVLLSNSLAASDYRVSHLHEELSHLAEINTNLLAQKSSEEDPIIISKFAQNQGMVEAKNGIYVFENGSVALH